MADLVERLFVGGPWDGRREQTYRDLHLIVGPQRRLAIYASDGDIREVERPDHTYRLHKAPTGERVFLADGAQWNEHVDTEAWPRRVVTGHQTWTKLDAWFWVGTGLDESMDPPPAWRWRGDLRHYVMADVSRSPEWLQLVHSVPEDLHDVDFDMDAYVARDLRQAIEYELLPVCPRDGCTEKAICKMIVPIYEEWRFVNVMLEPPSFRPGLDRIEQLCGKHASELRKARYDVRTYREGP